MKTPSSCVNNLIQVSNLILSITAKDQDVAS